MIRRKINFYDEFKGWYNTIIKDFNFDAQKDSFARDYLSNIIRKKNNWNLETVLSSFQDDLLKKEFILVYGCGPSLEITLDFLLRNKVDLNSEKIFNIAADGASRLLKERYIKIEAIFSDLDGITKNEFIYPNYIVVHAHGDNIEKLQRFENEIVESEKIIFTCQVEPNDYVINHGGFTDGDRILYFLRSLLIPSHRIFLIGMDFINKVGKYSKIDFQKSQKASKSKQKKLRYAAKLIDWLDEYIENEICYVNSQKASKRYKNLNLIQFLKEFK